jgi:hypothetical protein
MSPIYIVLLLLAGIGLVVLIVMLVITLTKEKPKLTNNNIVWNFMPQYTDGYAVFNEVFSHKIDNRTFMELEPKDIDVRDIEEEDNIKTYKIVVGKNKVETLALGNLSRRRALKILLPKNPEDFPKEFRETSFGQLMMKHVEKINSMNIIEEVVRSGKEMEDRVLRKTEGGGRVEEYLDLDEGLNKELANKALETSKKSETKPFYGSPSPSI